MKWKILTRNISAILGAVFWLGACSSAVLTTPSPVSPLNLAAYATQTRLALPDFTVPATETPAPTATPQVYTIARGDTLSVIAQRYGVTLADLLALNPGILPEALAVGQIIKIPAAAQPGQLAPAAAGLGRVVCYPSGNGEYCLAPIHNPGSQPLQNVIVKITLFDSQGQAVVSQTALLPLDLLPAGQTLPAAVFFPGVSGLFQPQAQLMAALPLAAGDNRYLEAHLDNVLVSIDWGGRSAQVQGRVKLPSSSQPAQAFWLAGVAYDVDENMIGVRRWEWVGSLAAGQSQGFSFPVYSLGPAIARVDVFLEVRAR